MTLADSIASVVPVRYQNIVKQFAKFAITGAIGAVVDFGTYIFLTRFFGWKAVTVIAGLQFPEANFVSVPLAIFCNFLLNKYWSFRDNSTDVARQGLSYFLFNFMTFVLNQLVTSLFFSQVSFMSIFGSKRDLAAKVIAIGIILFINFLGSKLLIFRRSAAATPVKI